MMPLRQKIAGLIGLGLTLLLVPDAHAFHHHWLFHHHQGGTQSQGVFPWQQLIPPLLQAGQQLLSSGNTNPPPSTNIVNSDVKSAIDKTTSDMKALSDRLKDLPPLNQPKVTVTQHPDGSQSFHVPKSPSASRVPLPPG